jgi:Uma2 family endonuclease
MATPALMTVEEFAQMETADTEAYELVDGVLVALPSPTPLHSVIRGRLEHLILSYLEQNPIGGAISETDSRLGRRTVRRPDLSIFLGDSWKNLDLTIIPIQFAPDIAVEVLSPSEHSQAFTRKIRDYLAAGSREVWVLDHANGEVTVRTKSGVRIIEGNDLLETPLLPGFSVSVAALLAER